MTSTPKLQVNEGNVYTLPYTAELLGVSRQGLYYLLHKHDISPYQAKRNPETQHRPWLYLTKRQVDRLMELHDNSAIPEDVPECPPTPQSGEPDKDDNL